MRSFKLSAEMKSKIKDRVGLVSYRIHCHLDRFLLLYLIGMAFALVIAIAVFMTLFKKQALSEQQANCAERNGVLLRTSEDSICIDKRFIAPEKTK